MLHQSTYGHFLVGFVSKCSFGAVFIFWPDNSVLFCFIVPLDRSVWFLTWCKHLSHSLSYEESQKGTVDENGCVSTVWLSFLFFFFFYAAPTCCHIQITRAFNNFAYETKSAFLFPPLYQRDWCIVVDNEKQYPLTFRLLPFFFFFLTINCLLWWFHFKEMKMSHAVLWLMLCLCKSSLFLSVSLLDGVRVQKIVAWAIF